MQDIRSLFVRSAGEEARTDLLHRLREREPQAFAEAYRIYGHLAFIVILRIVRDRSVAEDLVQEAFLRIWKRAGSLNEECASVGPWISQIARHCALDYLKSHARREIAVDWAKPISASSTIETDLATTEQAKLLVHAFAKLPPHQRRVIELAYYQGLSQSTIAQRLEQPLGTIKSWTRSALHRMREEISVRAPALNV